MNDPSPDRMFVVRFPVEPPPGSQLRGETLWAERLAPDRYRLWNVPSLVGGFAYHDVVATIPGDGLPEVDRVVLRSGHSTVWLDVPGGARDNPDFAALWKRLKAQGCGFESGGEDVTVDVPPEAELPEVLRVLRHGILSGVWEAQVGCAGPVHGELLIEALEVA